MAENVLVSIENQQVSRIEVGIATANSMTGAEFESSVHIKSSSRPWRRSNESVRVWSPPTPQPYYNGSIIVVGTD